MKKLLSLLILSALVLAACGSGSNVVAATVDSTTEVTVGEVEDLIDPADDAKVSKQTFADFLGFKIQWIIIEDAAEAEFGVAFTEDEIAAEADEIIETNVTDGTTREEFLETNEVTEEFLQNVAHQQLIDGEVRVELESELEPPSQEDIDAQMEQQILALTEVCASHILVETEDEADDVLVRLDEGEAFEDLAAELSTDTGSGAEGGDLGCSPPSRYVPEFADATVSAEVDVPTEPVETEFGFHVILVHERTEPEPEDLPTEAEITEGLNANAMSQIVNTWFIGRLEAAEVEVNEDYGTWQTDPVPGVAAPAE